ncbi:hypothetical protein EVAR_101285_1 [Eumeta japonica]|uniref:Uncharacterized protein n=1 Tax=Eumeta variegata TaxID=151549 RepID=A0A4C1SIP5_EUMVA|nr:hypothetical protein EVAR_101285_1 [Eumeta japonica]
MRSRANALDCISIMQHKIPFTIKAVIKGVPVEIEAEEIKIDLERQAYSVTTVHRMHCRDGIALGMTLAILEKTEMAKDILKICPTSEGSGIYVEAPYRKATHWTKECNRTKKQETDLMPTAGRSIQQITADKVRQSNKSKSTNSNKVGIARNKPAGGNADFVPAPSPKVNSWLRAQQVKAPLPARDTTRRQCPKPTSAPRNAGTAASALREDIST